MEILPAFLSWATIVLMFVASFYLPVWVAVFIILFDIYWFLKTLYLSFHLINSFRKLKSNLKINWIEKLEANPITQNKWKELFHLIILPMYDEPYEVVRETFVRLSQTNYPLDKFIVVLATEERKKSHAMPLAEKIKGEFGNSFLKLLITYHPQNLPGEKPGKGSNESWAAKQVKNEIIDTLAIKYEKIIASVFDIDTQVYENYFGILTHTFLTCPHPLNSSFQPVPLFLNNIYQAPALARIIGFSSSFWHLMQQSRPEKLTTFSSHSMPFKALVDIGFWQRDIVSEDSRIFWQCYVHHNGNWRTVPLFYPVSMDANVAPEFWKTMKNLYKQQRRWAWGSENIAYLMSGFRKNISISLKSKFKWAFHTIEGQHSWATSSLIIFSLGWLPIILGGQDFQSTLLAYNLPNITRFIMTFASIGIVSSAVLSMTFLPPKPGGLKKRQYLWYLISWLLMPITLIIFGSIPALEAHTRLALSGKFRLDFWVTPKHR
ncbi:MAG: glycosyltransferase family 2 protein [Candidatus Paceibacterota bacterium]